MLLTECHLIETRSTKDRQYSDEFGSSCEQFKEVCSPIRLERRKLTPDVNALHQTRKMTQRTAWKTQEMASAISDRPQSSPDSIRVLVNGRGRGDGIRGKDVRSAFEIFVNKIVQNIEVKRTLQSRRYDLVNLLEKVRDGAIGFGSRCQTSP